MTSHEPKQYLLTGREKGGREKGQPPYERLQMTHMSNYNTMSPTSEKDYLIDNEEKAELGVVEKYILPGVSEFVATMLFVFLGCLSVVGNVGGPIVNVALAHGFAVSIIVAGFGHISGAHINPAVTLGIAIAGGCTIPVAVVYLFAQLLGSLVGAGFVRSLSPADLYNMTNGGAQTINPAVVNVGTAIGCEILLTSVLVFVILMLAVDSSTDKTFAPLNIGLTVIVCALAGAWISGASMNPARTFGPAVVVTDYNPNIWKYHYIYWVGPVVGACVSGALYRLVFASPDKRVWRG